MPKRSRVPRKSEQPNRELIDDDEGEYGPQYPDCYLHVEECRTGQTWIVPIKGNMILDLKTRIKAWIKQEFGKEAVLDGDIMPRLQGDYYAKTKMDGNPPDSVSCWESGGFYLDWR